MTIERSLRLMAGAMILLSMGLAYFVSPWWYLLTLFVGLNLFQSGLTNWCPAMWMLERMGVPYGGGADGRVHRPGAAG